jgi:hypothetical protein
VLRFIAASFVSGAIDTPLGPNRSVRLTQRSSRQQWVQPVGASRQNVMFVLLAFDPVDVAAMGRMPMQNGHCRMPDRMKTRSLEHGDPVCMRRGHT